MLLILSPSSAKSNPVRNEISFALDNGKTIIPVLYTDCAVPLQLRRIQYIDFRTDYDCALKTLLTRLAIPADADKVTRDEIDAGAERDDERLAQEEQRRAEHDAEMQRLKEESERLGLEAERLRKEAAEREAAGAKSREQAEQEKTPAPREIPAEKTLVAVPESVRPEPVKRDEVSSATPAQATPSTHPWKPVRATAVPERPNTRLYSTRSGNIRFAWWARG